MSAISLCRRLREHHMMLMHSTEQEAATAAQSGDRARQSLASTESERHRQTAHVLGLILDEAGRDFLASKLPDPDSSELPSWPELTAYWKERAEQAEQLLAEKTNSKAWAALPARSATRGDASQDGGVDHG